MSKDGDDRGGDNIIQFSDYRMDIEKDYEDAEYVTLTSSRVHDGQVHALPIALLEDLIDGAAKLQPHHHSFARIIMHLWLQDMLKRRGGGK